MIISINENEKSEFIGQIIDIFEDFLEAHGVTIENPERDADPDYAAIIYGSDYDELDGWIDALLDNWKNK